MLVQGQVVHVNPMDNHVQHIAIHSELKQRLENAAHPLASSDPRYADHTWASSMPGIMGHIDAHIAEHQDAMKGGGTMMQANQGAPNLQGQPSLAGTGSNGNQASNPAGDAAGAMSQLKSMLNTNGLNMA